MSHRARHIKNISGIIWQQSHMDPPGVLAGKGREPKYPRIRGACMFWFEECIDPGFPDSLPAGERIGLMRRMGATLDRTCPHCGSCSTVKKGKTAGGSERRLCRGCGQTYVRGNSAVFPGSHLGADKWMEFCRGFLNGDTMHNCSRASGVCLKTSSMMKRRLIEFICTSGICSSVEFAGVLSFET